MFPLVLAIVMAGLVVVIIFLLFRDLSKQKEDLSLHTLQMDKLKDEITQKDAKIKEVSSARDKCQEEVSNLKKGLAEKDKFYQEIKVKCDRLERQIAEGKNMVVQLEQQKRQFMDQIIKYKKLEKDLHAKQDEATALNKENQKLKQDKNFLEKELKQAKQGKVGVVEEQKRQEREEPKPEAPKEGPKPEAPKVEQKPERPEEAPKPEKPQEKPKPESKEKSPFNRFLKPKTGEEKREEPPQGGPKTSEGEK